MTFKKLFKESHYLKNNGIQHILKKQNGQKRHDHRQLDINYGGHVLEIGAPASNELPRKYKKLIKS